MEDRTEEIRRELQADANAKTDDEIPEPHWTTETLQRDFEVEGFMAPFVVVRRKSDGALGSLEFRHSPRVYYGWRAK